MNRFSPSHVFAILAAIALPALAAGASAWAEASSATPIAAASATDTSSSAGAARPKGVPTGVEQHIRQLHDQLGITSAQQSRWEQCAQVMRDNAAQMKQAVMDRGARVGTLDAAENMQSYAKLAQVHATNMQKLASSFQSLYASFPDRQKQVADDVFRKNNATRTRNGN